MSNFEVLEAYAVLRREVSLLGALELKNLEMGHKQMMILYKLSLGVASMGELADMMQSDPAATTRAVASLEAAGWVHRLADPNDKRRTMIELSAKGKPYAVKAQELRKYIGLRINETLSKEEQKLLAKLLNKVSQGLQEQRK